MFRNVLNALAAVSLVGLLSTPAMAASWNRADSKHFVVYGDGRASDLEDFTRDLENFDALLRMLWRLPDNPKQTRLTIYTVGNADEVARIIGRKNIAGFYSPRIDGSFAVSNRTYTTNRDVLSGQSTLFHEYAHHFMYRNFSIPAPSWFIEGFAEFVATAEFKKNGEWVFGKPAFHRANEVEYATRIPVRTLLQIGGDAKGKEDMTAFYGWSWALTHLLYSKEEGRGAKIVDYLNRINRGQNSIAAAEGAFGDLDVLDSKLRDYVKTRLAFSKSDKPIAFDDKISITPLSDAQGQVIELAMERRGRGTFDKALEQLRVLGAAPDASADALVELARAEYQLASRSGSTDSDDDDDATGAEEPGTAAPHAYDAAIAAVDRALVKEPKNVAANILKSRILSEKLWDTGEKDARLWDEAEQRALLANQQAPTNPEALYAYTQALRRQGKTNESLSPSLAAAYSYAPEVRELRFAHAFDLAAQGKFDDAIALVKFVANDPHGGSSGRDALKRIEAMRDNRVRTVVADD